jgi:exopolyphosphatase/guanosine-5'-triphosphate,3'-diphosphate pyrophosphatase
MVLGVLSVLDPVPSCSLIVDVGGGSSEFVLCVNQQSVWSHSLPLGVVCLAESYTSLKLRQEAMEDCFAELMDGLENACRTVGLEVTDLTLVGTAGTVTTLAAMDLGLSEYDW